MTDYILNPIWLIQLKIFTTKVVSNSVVWMKRKNRFFFHLPTNKILNLNNIHYMGARLQRRGFYRIHLKKIIFRLGEA